MKKQLLLLTFIFFVFSVSVVCSQNLIKRSLFTGSTYASDKVNRIYIPPPDEFFKKAGRKNGAKIDFYFTNFPASAITAVNHAVSILESILPDNVHITVSGSWENITTSGVLANSTATGYILGYGINAWHPWAVYPAALAEKIAGKKLNEDAEGDIELHVNSSVSWYLGIDGNTPSLRYDLVTVVLHELIHGLGFFDSYYADASGGSYGISSTPLIYDLFVENSAGQRLADTNLFKNPSAALRSQIISGSLYFDGPVVSKYTSGGRARLYSPSTYNAGSSIAHLDEDTYNGTEALLTPFIARGEAIHNPGNLTRSILGDIGWINTMIMHDAPTDTEEHISALTINTEIKSDTVYNHGKIGLTWSYDGFKTSNSVFMFSPGSDNKYTASIPVPTYETRINYFISAEDWFHRIYLLPSDTAHPYSVFIGTDTIKPVITHVPAEYYLSAVDTIRLSATVVDNLGVDTAYIEYRINDGPSGVIGLSHKKDNDYDAILRAKDLSPVGGDYFSYRIIATDKAASPNQRTLPSTGYFSVKFEQIKQVQKSYSTTFTGAEGDFLLNGFDIARPSGFTQYGLHTKHPYESPEETGDSIGYTAMLRIPVKWDESGIVISYNEIALVEPGEEGSTFGSSSFYDYVIVEGSGDFGKTWFHLTDGYDCRYHSTWLNAYNSVITGNNSTFVPNESMLVKHTVFPKSSSDISPGDTIIVRFRLFSDPYANGWGWVIEDLFIGPLINSINDAVFSSATIYPNPGNGLVTIRQADGTELKHVRYNVFSSTGALVKSGFTESSPESVLDITSFPSGLYRIVLYTGYNSQSLKYILIK